LNISDKGRKASLPLASYENSTIVSLKLIIMDNLIGLTIVVHHTTTPLSPEAFQERSREEIERETQALVNASAASAIAPVNTPSPKKQSLLSRTK
jgi:hypothetical protein